MNYRVGLILSTLCLAASLMAVAQAPVEPVAPAGESAQASTQTQVVPAPPVDSRPVSSSPASTRPAYDPSSPQSGDPTTSQEAYTGFAEEFPVDEGVWRDEFEDGKPSTAWFVYNNDYFTNPGTPAPSDPRIPHEQGTIYDDPIKAREEEGLLLIPGSLTPPGAEPAKAETLARDHEDLRRYKVITTDPVRGEFRADLKISLRGDTFKHAQLFFIVREHDWKFEGAREARVMVFFTSPQLFRYEGNWGQAEHFSALTKGDDTPVEDSITLRLQRGQDTQIQFRISIDDGEMEYKFNLGPEIETDLVDILIGTLSVGPDENTEGAIAIDSFEIRGPEVPDVEEGTEDQNLIDTRENLRDEYQTDIQGRFSYSEASLIANQAYTWMHFYGTQTRYPFLPPRLLQVQQPNQAFPGAFPGGMPGGFPGAFPGAMPGGFPGSFPGGGGTIPGTYPQPGQFPGQPGNLGQPGGPDPQALIEEALDRQGYPRGSREYFDEATKKYRRAAELDPTNYSTICKQIEWVHDVAFERIIRLMGTFRARTGSAAMQGGLTLQGNQVVKANYDQFVGDETGNRGMWDPRIAIFEGRVSPEVKRYVLNMPEGIALQELVSYFGPQSIIQTPVDLIARIPFLFSEDWMTIPLTLYVPDIADEVIQRLIAQNPSLLYGGGAGFSPLQAAGGFGGGFPGAAGGLGGFPGMGGGMGGFPGGGFPGMGGGMGGFPGAGGFAGAGLGVGGGLGGSMGGGFAGGLTGGFGNMGVGTGGGPAVAYSPLDDLRFRMGRGYTVVEYYGASYGYSDQVVYDSTGRLDPRATAERAFAYLRDFPGFLDLITEIIDPDQHGSVLLEWDFNFSQLGTIEYIPRTDIRPPKEGLNPPEILYAETEVPALINLDNSEIPRRYTLADYYGWQLGQEGSFREPEQPNHIAAFDSPSLPVVSQGY